MWRVQIREMAEWVPFTVDVRVERAGTGHQDPEVDQTVEGVAVVVVAGEVDLATVPELRDALSRVIASVPRGVVVDLAAVEFMDASGVGALVGAATEAARTGVRFRLQAPSPPVAKVLNLAQLDGSLAVDL